LKLRIVDEDKDRLEMEVGGEGHTLLNLLQSSLLENKDVTMAGYSKPHPLMDRSILYIHVKKGKDQKKVLIASAEDAKKKVDDFLIQFQSQISKKAN
jgi:DNA-directed RNA polymerase subunit L